MCTNNCVVCNRPKGKNKYCCSKICSYQRRLQWKECVVCGKLFNDPSSNKTKCCSSDCSKINRQQMYASGMYSEYMEKMIIAKERFYKEHFGENNVNSKFWVIQSPEGAIYSCQNLMHFLRTNTDLFDGTPKQAMDGFAKIKATAQGKRKKNPSYSWKGWKLIDWNDKTLGEEGT